MSCIRTCRSLEWSPTIEQVATIKMAQAGIKVLTGGELMKATDFDLSKDLQFSLERGVTTFRDSRLVIFDSNAIGLLRQSLIRRLGPAEAREFFLQFGFQNGY